MAGDPPTWRCPVCEGVNHGGRTCTTCGETLPAGFTPAAAAPRPVRTAPSAPAPAPPSRRSPSPEEVFGSNPFR